MTIVRRGRNQVARSLRLRSSLSSALSVAGSPVCSLGIRIVLTPHLSQCRSRV